MKKFLKKLIKKTGYTVIKGDIDLMAYAPDFEDLHKQIIEKCLPYTMTSREKMYGLIEAVRYIVSNKIEGDIVECGVWRGGSMMVAMEALKSLKDTSRNFYLYDTYEGMTTAGEMDVSFSGVNANDYLDQNEKTKEDFIWAYSPLDSVKNNVYSTGYEKEKISFIKGKVEDTIPGIIPDKISLLRLDTDWYESTKHEMNYLFPRLVKGGILILDDYGHWEGAKKAVNEYLTQNQIKLFLSRLDYSGRLAVKQ